MKLPHLNMFRQRKRNTVILLVGIAAGCLIFLAWRDNVSPGTIPLSRKRLKTVTKLLNSVSLHSTERAASSTVVSDVYRGLNQTVRQTGDKEVQRRSFIRRDSSIKPNWNRELYYNVSSTPEQFLSWRKDKQPLCNDKITGYGHEFLEVQDVIIDRKFCSCNLQGGELIESVINQDEMAEYYKFEMGCFQVAGCNQRPNYYFNGENHLTKWMYSVATHDVTQAADRVVDDFTLAITRYEYANLFHTMTDWYNAFLIMQFFNHTSFNTNILIVDAHPYGALDSVWNQLFNSTVRLAGLPARTRFRNLVWGIQGYNSLMKIYVSPNPPLLEQFRHFFLSTYDINTQRSLDCKRLNILFIWRHNYLAHPRNPTGFVTRKIHNEDQLIRYVKRRHSESVVTGIQIDAYSMKQQLQYVADADILVGMHGAGLTHAVFLQKRAALIELVPNYWSPLAEHFKAICVWRGLIYKQWFNSEPRNEFPDQSTTIPPEIMNTLIKNTIRELCGH